MKNATIEDVEEAKLTGVLKQDVMYAYKNYKVHGKHASPFLPEVVEKALGKGCAVVEDSLGELFVICVDYLKPPSKGPATLPKKVKRKPVKGSRPERKIPFAEYVKEFGRLKAGDVVCVTLGRGWCRKKNRVVITGDDGRPCAPYETKEYGHWNTDGSLVLEDGSYITHVILPYQEPVKEQTKRHWILTFSEAGKDIASHIYGTKQDVLAFVQQLQEYTPNQQ